MIRAKAIGGGKSGAGRIAGPASDPAQDLEHLRLLSVFQYVLAAICGVLSLLPLIHLAIGVAILSGQLDGNGDPPPPFLGWMLVIFPLVTILGGMAMALAIAVAGRKLQRRSGYMYCLVIAGLECILMPIGTVLGVFTIIVLMRPSVKQQFGITPAAEV